MRTYPRATLKRLVRAHLRSKAQPAQLSARADLYIYLAWVVFLRRLARESIVAMQMDADVGVAASTRTMAQRHVRCAARRLASLNDYRRTYTITSPGVTRAASRTPRLDSTCSKAGHASTLPHVHAVQLSYRTGTNA
ncbi:hypothetical protein K437DRAFT_271563 [Tilletiaria anomala UBC 951]|uniref:Uncharacterized protein n=1 Tax=Tilletiaria anomala (strain ATCC 24038 / CBS 436.72 / UBC 951) TaxID=1037660 RepID=A0A066WII0_TILAU|nr:uncharacterized protein K437DRAFT_271563 [Tilletiaria anomala UBC 951]KDN53651.1 hypothetical protein K437DRAFT_271563 [Tilletiaria anomala UBC 951]